MVPATCGSSSAGLGNNKNLGAGYGTQLVTVCTMRSVFSYIGIKMGALILARNSINFPRYNEKLYVHVGKDGFRHDDNVLFCVNSARRCQAGPRMLPGNERQLNRPPERESYCYSRTAMPTAILSIPHQAKIRRWRLRWSKRQNTTATLLAATSHQWPA